MTFTTLSGLPGVLVLLLLVFEHSSSTTLASPSHKQTSPLLDAFSIHKIEPKFNSFDAFRNLTQGDHHIDCHLDQGQAPVLEELTQCKNGSMFKIWRPKARLIAPRGWMNDPMAIYSTRNGTFHVGYECNPYRNIWGNCSQCSASTTDFVQFKDYGSWKNPITISPTQLYDIRGVFDGTIIQNGFNGHPTLIYTSVSVGALGAKSNPAEHEGVETQSLAYTQDDGQTWTKLNFGTNGLNLILPGSEIHSHLRATSLSHSIQTLRSSTRFLPTVISIQSSNNRLATIFYF